MQPWTYSHLDSYESCPRKFYELKVAKTFVDPPNEHNEWGNRVHKAFEDRLLGKAPMPEGMTQWEPLAAKLDAMPGEKLCEYRMSIDKGFQPAPWKTSWSRGIIDLLVVHKDHALVLDYKTGKRKPTEQLDLYANYVFAHYAKVRTVTTSFVWLKDRRIDKKKIERDETPVIWQGLLPRVAKLESAYARDKWPERPSGLCNGWCPVTSCKFNKPKKT